MGICFGLNLVDSNQYQREAKGPSSSSRFVRVRVRSERAHTFKKLDISDRHFQVGAIMEVLGKPWRDSV